MTDKQIIIDEIDVSECIYYDNGKCLNDEMVQCSCKNVAVCYYKEYKRKEQECEEWKIMLKDLSFENQKFCYQIEEQTKQLEPFKDEYFKGLETIIIAELAKKSIRITAENRKLEQTLTDIKEIVGIGLVDGLQSEEYSGFLKILQAQILQKISECEVE